MDNRTPSERFWIKVDRKGPDECWHWRASVTKDGYAGFRYRDRTRPAHRFAYEELHGSIPTGLVIDHNCHNLDASCVGGPACLHRRCVNPAHLRAVSQAINLGSSRLTVNFASTAVTHCPKGHPYSGDNLAHDGADRCCRTCKRQTGRDADARRNPARRERYALLRAAGFGWAEARTASKAKVADINGTSHHHQALG